MKKKNKKQKPNNPAPGDRVSIFGSKFAGSDASEWTEYQGLGWVHVSEFYSFQVSYAQCLATKKWMQRDQMASAGDGYIDRSLIGNGWFICEASGYAAPQSEAVEIRDRRNQPIAIDKKHLARATFKDMVNGNIYLSGEMVIVYPGPEFLEISQFTYNSSGKFCMCDQCSRHWRKEQVMVRAGGGGNRMCPSCHEVYLERSIILAHDSKSYPAPIYKPSIVRLNGKKMEVAPVRLFGVEAELEIKKSSPFSRAKVALEIQKALGGNFSVNKHDGSLSGTRDDGSGGNFGFETVSAPADLATHRERWPLLLGMECYPHLKSWSTDTCGFHVHVSRECLSTLQIGRILTFINYPANAAFVQKVAGRGQLKWSKYVPKGPSASMNPERGSRDECRRVAVNVQNAKTVEFRIFRGTIWPRHMIRNIEFVDAVCDFCLPQSRSFRELLDYKAFIRFADCNRTCDEQGKSVSTWPMLREWMMKAEMVPSRKAKPGQKAKVEPGNPEESEAPFAHPRKLVHHPIGIKAAALGAVASAGRESLESLF